MGVEAAGSADGRSKHRACSGKKMTGFPKSYAGLTPAEKKRWLAGEECAGRVRDRELQVSQVEAEARRLRRAAAKVAPLVPSPCRLDEFWRGYPFPPPAEHTPMRRAAKVLDETEQQVLWPAHYLSGSGATYDVVVYETEARRQAIELKPRRGESHAQSASADALRAAAAAGAVIDTGVTLLTEDEQVLKQQIALYLAGKKTSLLEMDADERPGGVEPGA